MSSRPPGRRLAATSRGDHQGHRWAALIVVCASALIINLDNTILNVALPTLVRQLHATASDLQWIVDSYAMVFAGLLLVGGSLGDRFGRKRFFLIGLTIFAAASIGAGSSGTVDLLIAWRAVMGVGAALTIPASLSIVNDMFRDPGSGPELSAHGLGPSASGSPSVRSPAACCSRGSGGVRSSSSTCRSPSPPSLQPWCWCPNSKNPASARPDPGGSVLSIAALGLLLWAIIEGPTEGWTSLPVVGAGVAGLMVLGAFVIWEARSSHPMLKLGFFRNPRFSMAAAAEMLGTFGLLGALFVQTQFLQFDLLFSPLQAGLRILPLAAVLVVSATLSPRLARVIGVKLTIGIGLAAIAGGLWQISAASAFATTYGEVVPGLLLLGLGAGLLLPTATNSVVGSVPQGDSGVGSATNAVALQVGGALGVAVIGSVLSTRYQERMTAALAGQHVPAAASQAILGSIGGALTVAAKAGGATGVLLAHAARTAFMSGSGISLAAGAIVAVAGALLVLARLPSRVEEPSPIP